MTPVRQNAVRLAIACTVLATGLADRGQSQQPAPPPVEQQPWLSINVTGHTASVRALAFTADSKRLCSAGLDKLVQVWNTGALVRDIRRTWLLERTLRWQVGRGLRGSIYALATAPSDGLLAIGGYGAMGGLGEILLVDPVQGTLHKLLTAHRQTVCSLAFSADGQWLASLDVAGQLVLWKRGDWQPIVVYENDARVYGTGPAAIIERQPHLRPLAIRGSSHVIVPVYMGLDATGRTTWRLQQIGLTDRRDVRTFDMTHVGMVSALAASADGRLLASADLAGNLYLGEPAALAEPLAPEGVVLSLGFDPRGQALVAGTAVSPLYGKGQLEVWDTTTRALKGKRLLAEDVRACAVSRDGKYLACSGGEHNALFLGAMGDLSATVPLQSSGRRVTKVAFARQEPLYRVALSTTRIADGFHNDARLQRSFNPVSLELSGETPPAAADWLPVEWSQGRWSAQKNADGTLQFFRDNVAQGIVRLDTRFDGTPRCCCWIGRTPQEPTAVAIGTDVQNGIYVCRLAPQGPCPVLRHFRGHYDVVESVAVSRDMRYLASGSADGTVRFWSLSDLDFGLEPRGRWGAQFAKQGDRLTVMQIDPAGPLFFKGVRSGDTLAQIRWPGGGEAGERRADWMYDRLTHLPWDAQVVFETARGGQPQPAFQLVPAWQPMATLFVTDQREWAFWTPAGYYDASLNGHTLFGWQVNRGADALPDFFRADQFRKKLERPDVLEKLFSAGHLDGAFRAAALEPPKPADQEVSSQIDRTPRVDILEPKGGETLPKDSATVRVRIRLPAGGKLTRAKVFASGVVAADRRLVGDRVQGDAREVTYQWQAALPSEDRNLIQVVVDTDADVTGINHVVVERAEPRPKQNRRPRLYLLALGIDRYEDPSIQPLAYSVADARAVLELLKSRAAGLYELAATKLLVNEQVTREAWKETFARLRAELVDDVRPDDLLVIFLAGHGFVDPAAQRYYYAGYDLTRDGFMNGRYGGSISWSDFELLADIPCRKLAFLDTCHSGAIQPLRGRNLKVAVRAFQEDVVLTVTAAAGDERSEENVDWKHGAFTKSLLEVLSGEAGASAAGVVTLGDVVSYVQRSVPILTEGRQNPAAAPEDLLPFVSLGLTALPRQARNPVPAPALVRLALP